MSFMAVIVFYLLTALVCVGVACLAVAAMTVRELISPHIHLPRYGAMTRHAKLPEMPELPKPPGALRARRTP